MFWESYGMDDFYLKNDRYEISIMAYAQHIYQLSRRNNPLSYGNCPAAILQSSASFATEFESKIWRSWLKRSNQEKSAQIKWQILKHSQNCPVVSHLVILSEFWSDTCSQCCAAVLERCIQCWVTVDGDGCALRTVVPPTGISCLNSSMFLYLSLSCLLFFWRVTSHRCALFCCVSP